MPDSASTPTVCPFCGHPLLNKQAVDQLTRQTAPYEAKLEAQAEARAEVKIEEDKKSLAVGAAKQVVLGYHFAYSP